MHTSGSTWQLQPLTTRIHLNACLLHLLHCVRAAKFELFVVVVDLRRPSVPSALARRMQNLFSVLNPKCSIGRHKMTGSEEEGRNGLS